MMIPANDVVRKIQFFVRAVDANNQPVEEVRVELDHLASIPWDRMLNTERAALAAIYDLFLLLERKHHVVNPGRQPGEDCQSFPKVSG